MSRPQKTLVITMWVLAVAAMFGVLALRMLPAGGQPASEAPPIFYNAPNFTLTDQNGKDFSDSQLRGQPWVADFVFTTCATICPMMSAHMQILQGELPEQVRLVSFSVDPQHDTPAVLRDYADKFHAQAGRWTFLTGDPLVQSDVVRAMKLYFKPANAAGPIEHDEHFVLVDGRGRVRGYYDSQTPAEMEHLVHDAKYMCDHPSEPADGAGQ